LCIVVGIVGYTDESGLLIFLGVCLFGLKGEIFSLVDDGKDGTFLESRVILHGCDGFVLEFIYPSVIYRQKRSVREQLHNSKRRWM
jgi:hypothetical protein